ncbi:MAG TPA: saccharopine dehydrogenase NADP-binding domain-containing protein [Steroidobacteraceae bacterium]|nr:saccharopine dehydrogenase NADP-binding domain-containing protein [Steroidobacteraceae bacterium]
MTGTRLLVYGATGYTGELIAREAVRRGLAPVLAGRNPQAVAALARALGCESRIASLDDEAALGRVLVDVGVVVHCAGPFAATSAPMVRACLRHRVHYVDITGEIDVLEAVHAHDAEARAAQVVLCPAAGFDVVPTDCLAARLHAELPDATVLALGFASAGRPSRGTLKTSIANLARGGRIRSAGRIVPVAHAFRERDIDLGEGVRSAVTIPWGDVSTAFHTTGIGNIEAYIAMARPNIAKLRRLNTFGGLLRVGFVRALLERAVAKGPPGPDAATRAATSMLVWGEVQAPSGERVTGRIRVANGYDVTVHASLAIATRLLAGVAAEQCGHRTPSQLMGSAFVETLPGSSPIAVVRDRAWNPQPPHA